MAETDHRTALVRSARSGDAEAFAQLLGDHYPALLASCQRMLADRELARDAAQEAALRAMLGLDHLRDDSRFGAWLIGIGLNVSRGLLIAGRRHVSLDALRDSGRLDEPAAEGTEAVEVIAAEELAVRVREAIAALPAGQREAVAMFYIGGLTQAEIADEIGTRQGAVKTRLHKARRTLRTALRDTYEDYIDMTDESTTFIPMRVAELRRTASGRKHILFLEDDRGRRLPIWIGQSEATAIALILEDVAMPRPGVHQLTVSLLAGAGSGLREIRITELTEGVFYARALLANDVAVDARPSDALTLALLTGAPIRVAASVLSTMEAQTGTHRGFMDEAEAAVDASEAIASEAQARLAQITAALLAPSADDLDVE